MVDHHRDHTLSDDSLDREIAALLEVDPSPNFVARVHSAAAAQPIAPGHRRWLTTRWIAVGAAAAVVLVGLAIGVSRQSVRSPAHEVVLQHVPAAVVPEPSPLVVSAPPVQSTPTRTRRPTGPRSNSSEVVISERDSAGLRYFLTALQDGRFDSTALLTEPADLDANAPIVIEPLTVDPLVTAADLEAGVSQ